MEYRYTDDERAPLLAPREDFTSQDGDVHDQFCRLVGVPPSDLAAGQKWAPANRSLYSRALRQRSAQSMTYRLTASISNILLLSQVVLGAAVTGLGASESSHVIITVLGAANTIIAGLVAYLKSRGQPMRARMYRDDLERVVDEIENSEIMWMGISKNVDGYDDIDRDGLVTVRSEVARLTRLYDKAVRNNTLNNPDMYGSGDHQNFLQNSLRNTKNVPAVAAAAGGQAPEAAPAAAPAPPAASAPAGDEVQAPVVVPVAADPDESPATAKPTPPGAIKVVAPVADDDKDKAKDKGKEGDDDNKKDADDSDGDDDKDSKASNKGSRHKTDSDKAAADQKKIDGHNDPKPAASTSKKADASSGDDAASKTSKDVRKHGDSDDEDNDGDEDEDDASSEEEEEKGLDTKKGPRRG